MVLVSTSMFLGGATAFILDNTIPATPEERGIASWTNAGTSDEEEEEAEEEEEKKTRSSVKVEEVEIAVGVKERSALELKEMRESKKGNRQNQDSVLNLVATEEGLREEEEEAAAIETGVDAVKRGRRGSGDGGYAGGRNVSRGGTYDLPLCTNFLRKWSKYTKYIPISPTYKR